MIDTYNNREDFHNIHRLDPIDYSICIAAGILAAAVDVFLVGIPEKTNDGIGAGPLSNYIRQKFDEAFPADKIKQLERQFKVPYDASTNFRFHIKCSKAFSVTQRLRLLSKLFLNQ